jgi:hypothetical protein
MSDSKRSSSGPTGAAQPDPSAATTAEISVCPMFGGDRYTLDTIATPPIWTDKFSDASAPLSSGSLLKESPR